MNRVKTVITASAFGLLLLVLLNSCEKYHSYSGSRQILRMNGILETTTDTTYYYSNNRLSSNELKAIIKLRKVELVKILN
jgi:hypothetical protein